MKSRNAADGWRKGGGNVGEGGCNLLIANKASWKIRGNGATRGYTGDT